jgi:hypothetical protein
MESSSSQDDWLMALSAIVFYTNTERNIHGYSFDIYYRPGTLDFYVSNCICNSYLNNDQPLSAKHTSEGLLLSFNVVLLMQMSIIILIIIIIILYLPILYTLYLQL